METNFDHWRDPRDDRKVTANFCMKEKVEADAMWSAAVFDVLNTNPVFNQRTSWTFLMDVTVGKLETYVRLDASD